jgi:hypothetical protein
MKENRATSKEHYADLSFSKPRTSSFVFDPKHQQFAREVKFHELQPDIARFIMSSKRNTIKLLGIPTQNDGI